MSKIVFLTGAGMSAESGLSTFRDTGGLWDKYPVEQVASHEGWLRDPELVNEFYNIRRSELLNVSPNEGHRLVALLENHHQVCVVTQNVDNLHEAAGSSDVVHLHGELMKVCSSKDPDNPYFIRTLTPPHIHVKPGEKAGDGSLLRPYIVFFGESVPKIETAVEKVQDADILVVIGTSLNVYPAAGLVRYARRGTPIYIIDPNEVNGAEQMGMIHIRKGASEGMRELFSLLTKGR